MWSFWSRLIVLVGSQDSLTWVRVIEYVKGRKQFGAIFSCPRNPFKVSLENPVIKYSGSWCYVIIGHYYFWPNLNSNMQIFGTKYKASTHRFRGVCTAATGDGNDVIMCSAWNMSLFLSLGTSCLVRKASLSEDAPPKANEKAHERFIQRLLCFKIMAVGKKRWAKGKIEGNCLTVKRLQNDHTRRINRLQQSKR